MKIRTFMNMDDSVFRVVVNTESFSQDDLKLMCQYGEPEINCGGIIDYEFYGSQETKDLGDDYVRVLHGFPYAMGFDSRDYGGSYEEAEAVGMAWKGLIVERIRTAMEALRSNSRVLPTEEVENV